MRKSKPKAKPARKRVKQKTFPRPARAHSHAVHSGARPQPLIAVKDVRVSSRWYRELLGARNLGGGSDHDHVYDRVICDGRIVLQLHSWDDEEHPNLGTVESAPIGLGVLLWFEVDDFDAVVERIQDMKATVIEEPHFNPGPRHREIWIRDPDNYVVVLASPDGEASPAGPRSRRASARRR